MCCTLIVPEGRHLSLCNFADVGDAFFKLDDAGGIAVLQEGAFLRVDGEELVADADAEGIHPIVVLNHDAALLPEHFFCGVVNGGAAVYIGFESRAHNVFPQPVVHGRPNCQKEYKYHGPPLRRRGYT